MCTYFSPTLCSSQDKSSRCVQCICVPSQSCICMYLHRNGGKPPGVSLGNLAFQIHLRSSGSQMLLCTISISLSTHSLALVCGSLSSRVSSTKLIAFQPPVASYFSPLTISHPFPNWRWFPLWEVAVSQSQTCEMMIEEHEPLTHQSLSLASALPRFHHHRLPYARLSSGCGHSDGDGCSWSDGPGDPPKVISVLASTCWSGP